MVKKVSHIITTRLLFRVVAGCHKHFTQTHSLRVIAFIFIKYLFPGFHFNQQARYQRYREVAKVWIKRLLIRGLQSRFNAIITALTLYTGLSLYSILHHTILILQVVVLSVKCCFIILLLLLMLLLHSSLQLVPLSATANIMDVFPLLLLLMALHLLLVSFSATATAAYTATATKPHGLANLVAIIVMFLLLLSSVFKAYIVLLPVLIYNKPQLLHTLLQTCCFKCWHYC